MKNIKNNIVIKSLKSGVIFWIAFLFTVLMWVTINAAIHTEWSLTAPMEAKSGSTLSSWNWNKILWNLDYLYEKKADIAYVDTAVDTLTALVAQMKCWSTSTPEDKPKEVITYSWNDIILSYSWESVTIMDRNLWATSNDVTWCNTFDWVCTNKAVLWNYYQWWNNKARSSTWTVGWNDRPRTDASGFGPWNYFTAGSGSSGWGLLLEYDETTGDWTTVRNNNLWWDTTNTLVARQWPCPAWYHVPTALEWEKLLRIYLASKWFSYTTTWGFYLWDDVFLRDSFVSELKIPPAGALGWGPAINDAHSQGERGYYWSSSPAVNQSKSSGFGIYSNLAYAYSSVSRAYAYSVRCFKN